MAISQESSSSSPLNHTLAVSPNTKCTKERTVSKIYKSHTRPKLPPALTEAQRLKPTLIPIAERKKTALDILSTSPLKASNRAKVEAYVTSIQTSARGSKTPEECWLHAPSLTPPSSPGSDSPGAPISRPHTISKTFTFRFAFSRITLTFHYGVWALLCADSLSASERQGLVEGSQHARVTWKTETWDLSHLCGNWVCVNPAHLVVETRSANLKRKECHQRGRCGGCEVRCVVGVQLKAEVLGNAGKGDEGEDWDSDI